VTEAELDFCFWVLLDLVFGPDRLELSCLGWLSGVGWTLNDYAVESAVSDDSGEGQGQNLNTK
jgi:hypothetical protein